MRFENQYSFIGSPLQGIDDVLLVLERLEHDLPASHLPMLGHFNKTYLIITRNVRQHMRRGGFEHPRFLEAFDARFAYYYLHALEQYLKEDQVPRAWQHAFNTAQQAKASPLVCMALGVNAHVNNDIPQVLLDCGASHEHYQDYLQVNDIIKRSLDEVLQDYKQERHPFSPHRQLVRPLYVTAMERLIKLWRHSAWQKYHKLKKETMDIPAVEVSAHRMGQGIVRLPL